MIAKQLSHVINSQNKCLDFSDYCHFKRNSLQLLKILD